MSSQQEASFGQKIAGRSIALIVPRLLSALNVRVTHYDESADPVNQGYNEHAIFVLWHENIGAILPRYGHTPLTLLVSQHRDGEWLNQMALSLGMRIVRGSTSRGGSSAIRHLKKCRNESSIAITPDGPRGPRRKLAMGPIFLASLLDMPIIPIGIGIDDAWRLNTWDKFAIPKPFSRTRMIFGPKIRIPRRNSRQQLEDSRLGVEKLLNDLSDHAFDWACSGKKMLNEHPFIPAHRRRTLTLTPPRSRDRLPAIGVTTAPSVPAGEPKVEAASLKVISSASHAA